jgi:hypothetical protein
MQLNYDRSLTTLIDSLLAAYYARDAGAPAAICPSA